MHDGLILSWDTGLGKTWAMFLWPLLKCGYEQSTADIPGRADLPTRRIKPNQPILIIAPGDLHAQITAEAWNMFRIHVFPIDSQDEFQTRTRKPGSNETNLDSQGRPVIAPEFYITSYTQLTTNGVAKLPDPENWQDAYGLLQTLSLKVGNHQETITGERWSNHPDFKDVCEFFAWRKIKWHDDYHRLDTDPDASSKELEEGYLRAKLMIDAYAKHNPQEAAKELEQLSQSRLLLRNLFTPKPNPTFKSLAPSQQQFVLRTFLHCKLEAYAEGMGETADYEKFQGRWTRKFPDPTAEVDPNAALPEEKFSVKCVYSPSLSDLCYNAFKCVVIDEGVKMKGEETHVGLGVRQMAPDYRLLLTATPVKNRLTDIFRLAWWAAGGKTEAHARFPYRDDISERTKFAQTFMVSECNLSKMNEAEASSRSGTRPPASRYTKLTAEVCNVHRLWKLLGPLVLRRRKDDCNEDIVPKIRKVIRCDMGTLQQKVYSYHLKADYLDVNEKDAIAARLQALRSAAADPSSDKLIVKPGNCTETCKCALKLVPEATRVKRLEAELSGMNEKFTIQMTKKEQLEHKNKIEELKEAIAKPIQTFDRVDAKPDCKICNGTGDVPLPHRSQTAYVPKMATTLTLIEEILARKEQCVVFSAFNDPLDRVGEWLDEAGVRYCKLDGRTSQKKRGDLAAVFKRGRYATAGNDEGSDSCPVMLAGVECMAEGHSFHLANNVILIAYSWAYDKFIQAINRVHRMTSSKPVNVYVVICTGTIDRKLESLIQDKGDAAELVLDGRLIGERTDEVNLAELLNIAQREFNTQHNTIDEAMLAATWPALREKLRASMAAWTDGAPVLKSEVGNQKSEVRSLKPAPIRVNPCPSVVKNPSPNYPPVIRRKIEPMKKIEVYHNSPLAAVVPPGTILVVPDKQTAAAADWKAQMAARAAKLKALMKPKADVWDQL